MVGPLLLFLSYKHSNLHIVGIVKLYQIFSITILNMLVIFIVIIRGMLIIKIFVSRAQGQTLENNLFLQLCVSLVVVVVFFCSRYSLYNYLSMARD